MFRNRRVHRDLYHIEQHAENADNAITSQDFEVAQQSIRLIRGIVGKSIEREEGRKRKGDEK